MMKRVTAVSLIAAVSVMLLSCSQSDRPVILKYRYEPGLQLSYVQISENHIKVMDHDSVTKDYSEQVQAHVTQTVKRVLDDGTAQIEELAGWSKKDSGRADSASADTMSQSRRLSIYTAPNGKIVDVVFEKSVDSATAAYLRNFYDQNSVIFPDTAVRPGGSWTQRTKVEVEGSQMDASTTYRVVGYVQDSGYDCIQISYDGTLIIPIIENPSDTVHRHGVDRINMTGTLTFATELGMLVNVREKWKILSDREKTIAGKTVKTNSDVDMAIQYALKERLTGATAPK